MSKGKFVITITPIMSTTRMHSQTFSDVDEYDVIGNWLAIRKGNQLMHVNMDHLIAFDVVFTEGSVPDDTD